MHKLKEIILEKKVILIEDLTTDGGSKIKFCDSIRKAGAKVEDAIVLFYYNIYDDVIKKLQNSGINLLFGMLVGHLGLL